MPNVFFSRQPKTAPVEKAKKVRRGAPKGHPKWGGRANGTPNKITSDVRQMVVQSLEMAGGAAYLVKQAELNPVAYMNLVSKILPQVHAGDPANPIVLTTAERVAEAKRMIREAFTPLTIEHREELNDAQGDQGSRNR